MHLKGFCIGLTDSKVLLPDLDKGGFSCFLCIVSFFLPSSDCYRRWKLIEMAELGVQESEQEESRDRVLVNISMPCHHLALHINPFNGVFYNALRVCKTSLPLTSPRVLAAS